MLSLMEEETLSAPEKVEIQLKKNIFKWKEIAKAIKKDSLDFAITVARGSSYNAAIFAKYLFETKLGLITSSSSPSVITIYKKNINLKKSMVIAISQSGQSPDICKFLEYSTEQGAETISIVNDIKSPLGRLSKHTIPIFAGKEISVAATKSFITSLTALAQFIAIYNDDKDLLSALEKIPEYLDMCCQLEWSECIDFLSKKNSLYTTGRGYSFPIALEAALKLKETASIHAEGFSSAEILHGPFSLIKSNFPVLVFGQDDASLKKTLDLTEKMTRMGAYTLLAVPTSKKIDNSTCTYNLPTTGSLHSILDPILMIQSFYILAGKISKYKGLNPDKPDNLMKVTKTI